MSLDTLSWLSINLVFYRIMHALLFWRWIHRFHLYMCPASCNAWSGCVALPPFSFSHTHKHTHTSVQHCSVLVLLCACVSACSLCAAGRLIHAYANWVSYVFSHVGVLTITACTHISLALIVKPFIYVITMKAAVYKKYGGPEVVAVEVSPTSTT